MLDTSFLALSLTLSTFLCPYLYPNTRIGILQEFGPYGIECVVMEDQRTIAAYSRYGVYRQSPNPMSEEKAAVEFVYAYCAKERLKPVLFPLSDEWATALAKYKPLLAAVALPCVADWETVRTVVEKDRFYRLAQTKGYLTPHTWEFGELGDLRESAFPIVAKPRYRRFSFDTDMSPLLKNLNRLRCCVLHSKQELETFLAREAEFLDYLIFQDYVAGMSDSMYIAGIYANQQSEVLGLFTGHKVRGFPADIGNCVVGENYAIPEELITLVKRIVSELKIQGIAEFEFKKDANRGDFRLIEINLRPWSWVGITPACGVSLPYIAYRDLGGELVEYTAPRLPNGSVKYVKLLEDAKNSLFRYKKTYPPWHKNFWQWKRDISADKVVLAEFRAGDWAVGVKAIWDLFLRLLAYPFRQN